VSVKCGTYYQQHIHYTYAGYDMLNAQNTSRILSSRHLPPGKATPPFTAVMASPFSIPLNLLVSQVAPEKERDRIAYLVQHHP
jgi:hypothetical protein